MSVTSGTDAKDSMKAAALAEHERRRRSWYPKTAYPPWTTFAQGRLYRPAMKIAHRLGFCFTTPSGYDPDAVWCRWCGMRGRR